MVRTKTANFTIRDEVIFKTPKNILAEGIAAMKIHVVEIKRTKTTVLFDLSELTNLANDIYDVFKLKHLRPVRLGDKVSINLREAKQLELISLVQDFIKAYYPDISFDVHKSPLEN